MSNVDLFEQPDETGEAPPAPLAERVRPRTLEEFAGQEHLLGEGSLLRRLIARDSLPSMIFWGPPGSGKTTLASIIAHGTESRFISLSAVIARIADVKRLIEEAQFHRRRHNRSTILFVDEIHRFNKAQQDAFLPHVESGAICLIGATTENPSFSVIAPLLSRSKVFALKALSAENLAAVVRAALADAERGYGKIRVELEAGVIEWLCALADGDARRTLNLLEIAVSSVKPQEDGLLAIALDDIKEIAQRGQLIYDRSGEEHFNLISALHKSMRSSDVQAALYWTARMLAAGEDPLYLARRMVRFASEDVGMADPNALTVCNQAKQAYESLGRPEGELALAQAAVYLATAPKSNALYTAYGAVQREIQRSGSLPTPLHIRNAPTKLMKDEGYGRDYQYDHDRPDSYSGQECLPEELAGAEYYQPSKFGFEREVQKRLDWWKGLKENIKDKEE